MKICGVEAELLLQAERRVVARTDVTKLTGAFRYHAKALKIKTMTLYKNPHSGRHSGHSVMEYGFPTFLHAEVPSSGLWTRTVYVRQIYGPNFSPRDQINGLTILLPSSLPHIYCWKGVLNQNMSNSEPRPKLTVTYPT